ncbi:LVIVD repeat-containing protein [Cesiribacter sp. SM1]|uniref:LVIVD repeat-containing protein n=1 Tax=Cesiribacter sp. SM1 TaxID=2861196 RepID=UPI001CD34BDC|nr:hypothetical protein [Cesiribacter sp. SM1]
MKKIHLLFIIMLPFLVAPGCSEDSSSEVMPGAGLGGSMAQFTVYNGQLYLLQSSELRTYSLENPAAPQLANTQQVGIDAETLFPYSGNLYVGSQGGMHIYSLDNPQQPQHLSTFQHITSCDPVVVEGNFAYVTLRSGSPCRFGVNELNVLNISDKTMPQLISSMVMNSPQGLAVNNGILYVCNAEYGMVALDVTNPFNIKILKEYKDFDGYDVIFTPRSLMMIGKDGLVQYNPADPAKLQQLSIIPVVPVE